MTRALREEVFPDLAEEGATLAVTVNGTGRRLCERVGSVRFGDDDREDCGLVDLLPFKRRAQPVSELPQLGRDRLDAIAVLIGKAERLYRFTLGQTAPEASRKKADQVVAYVTDALSVGTWHDADLTARLARLQKRAGEW